MGKMKGLIRLIEYIIIVCIWSFKKTKRYILSKRKKVDKKAEYCQLFRLNWKDIYLDTAKWDIELREDIQENMVFRKWK